MKVAKNILRLFILVILAASAGYAQQTFNQTVTAQNRSCNSTCTVLDVGDNINRALIIFATPVSVNGVNPNPQPIGAYWMYQNKWSIYNMNGAAMPLGTQFNVEYYTNADANHFVYFVPQRINSNDLSYIDHAGLNNNPNAQIRVFPTNTTTSGTLFNRSDVRVVYVASDSKWIIANNNNATMPVGAAYNVMFSSGGPVVTNTNLGKTINPNTKTPESIIPSEKAGGDLNGNYPNPTVIGLQGKPLSSNMPTVGQTLGWNGTEWIPLTSTVSAGQTPTSLPPNGNAGGDLGGTYPAPTVEKLNGRPLSNTAPTVGQVLKWNGTAWEPAADDVGTTTQTSTNGMQTFFKNVEEESPKLFGAGTPNSYKFVNHSYTITVTKNSRLIISGDFVVFASVPCFPCQPSFTHLDLYVNNAYKSDLTFAVAAAGDFRHMTVANFMMDVGPGIYKIEFYLFHTNLGDSPPTTTTAKYSSVIMVPQ